MERRLAAILAADVVGYARLIRVDEEGTIAALKTLRADLIDPKLGEHNGRIVKLMGDGMLAEFPSVVDAVRAAVETQQAVDEHNSDLPKDKWIEFRVGINLGDVVIDGDDIHGDGVNVAARLEGLAEPGGICISGKVYEEVRDRVDMPFEDRGEQEVKNINRPVRVWQWRPDRGAVAGDTVPHEEPRTLPDKPSIAVLPFDNMSGDPEQEFFSDGITEDLITAISRYRSLFVIARNTSFIYKGKSVDIKQVGNELGVRYVLEGSVRKVGNKVRITAQLVDATTGNHIWAERYDHDLDDIFQVQDTVTQNIAAALLGHLEAAVLEQARRKPPENLAAYEHVLRGRDYHHRVTKDDNATALRFMELAVDTDPEYSEAYTWRACVRGQALMRGYEDWTDDFINLTLSDSLRALELDENDAEAHRITCRLRMLVKQFDQAEFHLQRALTLNPNDPRVILQKGINLTWYGETGEAIPWIQEAIRRDPYHEDIYSFELGCTLFVAGRYNDAMAAFKKTGNPNIQHNSYMAACAAQLGDIEAADIYAAEVLKAKKDFSIDEYLISLPYKNSSDLDRHREALVKTMLPK
jgi:adenylate cyclase